MLRISLSLLFMLLILGCSDVEKKSNSIVFTLKNLKTDQERREFLETIYEIDQSVRKNWDVAILTHGRNSKEEKEAVVFMNETDDSNLEKISGYLKTYGYPTITKHGKKACRAPWMVLHHTSDESTRKDYFPIFYQAYKNKDIEPGMLSLYLNRSHIRKFGKRLSIPSPYQEEDLIDSLIVKLELH